MVRPGEGPREGECGVRPGEGSRRRGGACGGPGVARLWAGATRPWRGEKAAGGPKGHRRGGLGEQRSRLGGGRPGGSREVAGLGGCGGLGGLRALRWGPSPAGVGAPSVCWRC